MNYPMADYQEFDEALGEVLLGEIPENLGIYGATINALLDGEASISGGATVRFRIRVGGTEGLPDGTQFLTTDRTDAALTAFGASALAVVNPGGNEPIKVTGEVVAGSGMATWKSGLVTFDAPAAGSDVTAPVLAFDPPTGTTIGRNQTLKVDATDNTALRATVLTAEYPSGAWEVIHNGKRFAASFVAGSTRAPIAGGYRYTLKRSGGWPATPTISADPTIDTSGNIAT